MPEQTFEVSAELDPDKDVEHRVEAAVGEGNVAADEQGIIQLLADLAALNDAKFQQCLQKQDRSWRGLALDGAVCRTKVITSSNKHSQKEIWTLKTHSWTRDVLCITVPVAST